MKHLTIATVLGMGFLVGFINSVLSARGSTPQPYPTITYEGQSSDTFQGIGIKWFKGSYRDLDVAGLNPKDLNFAVALPGGYSADADTVYPLVLYLHGAGGRGSDLGSVTQRPVPKSFAAESQRTPEYAAIILAPQVPSSDRWVNTPWYNGPYVQSDQTYTDSMHLTIKLLRYLLDPNNQEAIPETMNIDGLDIDTTRLYIAGDSMGAYGVWDLVAREPGTFAAAIAGSGSGPKNKLDEIRKTPFWGIHGEVDPTVPNRLPTASDPDGDGTLGMMALLDPSFDNTASTDIIRLDNYADSADDPNTLDTLIYTEMPGNFGHATVAMQWTTRVSGVYPWMFAHRLSKVAPMDSLVADANGLIQSINGNDSGYFQGLDADGNEVGPLVPFVKNEDYLKTDYQYILN